MGGTGSSSKRKSSKKKRDKKNKGGRRESKKRRRTYDSDDDSVNSEHISSSTSKSDHRRRINKNKKIRRDHSVSSYSDDTDSDSMSTYDSGYKRRKSRRSRVTSKSIKKRARKRSPRPKSDADAHNVRKRKRSDKCRVVKQRKQSSKKKSRKHLSSSSSTDSESCSTCQSRSSSSTSDGKHRRSKVTLNNEIEGFRGRESYKTQKKRKERSPSFCSRHRNSDHSLSDDHSIGTLYPVSNSRHLKSVITVVNQSNDEDEDRYKDPHKEEIVCNQDDYPSPKSVESNEVSKMEIDYHSHCASNERICVENVAGEKVSKLKKSGINDGDKKNASDHWLDEANMNNFEKGKEIDVPAPAAEDLESILRLKALENLRIFRGGLQSVSRITNLEKNNESDVNGSSTGGVDDVQNTSTSNEGSSNDQGMNGKSGNSLERDFPPLKVVKPIPVNETVAHSLGGAAVLGCSEEDKGTSSRAVLAKGVSRSGTSPGAEATHVCSSSSAEPASSVEPGSGKHSSEQQNETKDGSQFEQKTMSVMRGGEMVQVSYKVYIPKKAPALARRQLKR